MKVYGIYIGGEALCEVEVEHKPWMPFRPNIRRAWLRRFLAEGLRRYFQSRECVVKT
jgi:hypothetical protein